METVSTANLHLLNDLCAELMDLSDEIYERSSLMERMRTKVRLRACNAKIDSVENAVSSIKKDYKEGDEQITKILKKAHLPVLKTRRQKHSEQSLRSTFYSLMVYIGADSDSRLSTKNQRLRSGIGTALASRRDPPEITVDDSRRSSYLRPLGINISLPRLNTPFKMQDFKQSFLI